MRGTSKAQWPDERSLGALLVVIFFFMINLFTFWTPAKKTDGSVTPSPSPTISAQPSTQASASATSSPSPSPSLLTWQNVSVDGYTLTPAYATTWGSPTTRVVNYKLGDAPEVFNHTELIFAGGPTMRISKLATFEQRERRTEKLDASVAALKLDYVQKKVAEPTAVFLPPYVSLAKTSAPTYIENSTSTLRGVYYFTQTQQDSMVLPLLVANLMTSDETVLQITYVAADTEGESVACGVDSTCTVPASLQKWLTESLIPAISATK